MLGLPQGSLTCEVRKINISRLTKLDRAGWGRRQSGVQQRKGCGHIYMFQSPSHQPSPQSHLCPLEHVSTPIHGWDYSHARVWLVAQMGLFEGTLFTLAWETKGKRPN